jgi:hypothetical protein
LAAGSLNLDRDGTAFFDGILADDGAAGGWLPVLMKDGKDVLLASDADKAKFVPQIDVSHQMYNNIWPSKRPDYMSASYLANKRSNARILAQKGLTNKHRMYEVRGNSVAGTTAFAPFTGRGLEPLDQQNVFVDMNRNGVWDARETPEQAWRRLGLLAANESLTRERYGMCVQNAARALATEGFLSEANAAWYIDQARAI